MYLQFRYCGLARHCTNSSSTWNLYFSGSSWASTYRNEITKSLGRYCRNNAGDILFRLHDAVLTCRKLDLSKNRVGIHNLHLRELTFYSERTIRCFCNLTNQISEYRSCEPHPPFENNEHHWIWLSLELTVVFKPTGAVWVLWRAQMVFSEEIDQAMCLQGRCLDGTKTDPKHLTLGFWLALKAS